MEVIAAYRLRVRQEKEKAPPLNNRCGMDILKSAKKKPAKELLNEA
jgi:hypothetical protein